MAEMHGSKYLVVQIALRTSVPCSFMNSANYRDEYPEVILQHEVTCLQTKIF